MNTEFYNEMLTILRKNEVSKRQLAQMCGLSYGTLIEFFNIEKPFRPLRDQTMSKLHNRFGISYEVMTDYNNFVKNDRLNKTEREWDSMYNCYFKNLETGKEFCKQFENPYLMNKFLTKCRYSKRIRFIGKTRV